MRIIARPALRNFWQKYPDSKSALEAWYDEVSCSEWENTHDIKVKYPHASFVGNNRVVFNIGGNKYRLIVSLSLKLKAVYIKFIGTHAEYDKVNAATVSDY